LIFVIKILLHRFFFCLRYICWSFN